MKKNSTNLSFKDFILATWEFLKHPVTALVLGVLLTVVFFYLGRKEIAPQYATSPPELLAKQTLDAPNLKLFWDNEEIKDISSVSIIIWNAGRQYIGKDALSKTDPLRVAIPSGVNVLYVDVVQTSRNNLKFSTTFSPSDEDRQSIILEIEGDEALEYQDGAVFKILFTGNPKSNFQISGRILGAKDGFANSKWPTNENPSWTQYFISLLVSSPFMITYLRIPFSNRKNIVIGFACMVLAIVVIFLVSDYLNKNGILTPVPWLAK